MNAVIAELRVAQSRYRIVFIQALLGFGGRLDMPSDQRHAERGGHLFGQQCFTGARLAFDQQGPLQCHRGVDGGGELIGGYVFLCTGKLHSLPLFSVCTVVWLCRAVRPRHIVPNLYRCAHASIGAQQQTGQRRLIERFYAPFLHHQTAARRHLQPRFSDGQRLSS